MAAGEGGCSDLSPGHRFALHDHPAAQLDGTYVVTRVEHRGQTHPEAGRAFRVYWNEFECAPSEMTYCPPRPKRKSVQVALTATVVGPPGEEIWVDAVGQIKVQFHWDRDGTYDDRSSCWIRVMQPWAGAGWGHQFIPRVGMEVVVVFEGGDTDKPLVLGSLYNGTHPMPFKLPEDKTRSGIRTESSRGGGGFNELSFEDAQAREQIYVHAQRDLDEVVRRNHTLLVQNDELIRILQNRVDRVEKNLEEYVSGDHKSRVGGHRVDVVEGNEDRRVSGMLVTRVEGKERREVQRNADLVYAEDLTTRALGNVTTIVGKSPKKRSWVTHAEGTAELCLPWPRGWLVRDARWPCVLVEPDRMEPVQHGARPGALRLRGIRLSHGVSGASILPSGRNRGLCRPHL
jgi:type VI secretion system secreted protein VgrG